MTRKILYDIDSILLEFHNTVKNKLLVIHDVNNVSHNYSSLSRLFDAMTIKLLENRCNRNPNEECRTSCSTNLEEESITGENTSGDRDDGSYSDSSFIPEDDEATACSSRAAVK